MSWATAVLTACAIVFAATTSIASEAKTLTVSSWVPATHFIHTAILAPYAEKITKITDSRVRIRFLPAALGSPPQHFDLARKRAADITWGNFTYEADRFISMGFAEFPFSGSNAEAASVALWRVYDKHLKSNPAFEGVKILGVGQLGGGQIHHRNKAVVRLDDLKNQKVRMSGGRIQKRMLEELGAVPVAAPAPKTYELLASGVVDAVLLPPEGIVSFRLEEYLKFHTIIPDGIYNAPFFVAINATTWEGLSSADRAAIERISGEALSAEWGRQFDRQNEEAAVALKAAGHTIEVPSPELLAKVREVSDALAKDWIEAAKNAGIADPAKVFDEYQAVYSSLANK